MLMIIETRNHRERIWTATDEADLLAKVRAEAEQRRSYADIETVADAIRYTQERDASRVEVLTQADYEAVEGWSDEVSATAARIWDLAPAGEDYEIRVIDGRSGEGGAVWGHMEDRTVRATSLDAALDVLEAEIDAAPGIRAVDYGCEPGDGVTITIMASGAAGQAERVLTYPAA